MIEFKLFGYRIQIRQPYYADAANRTWSEDTINDINAEMAAGALSAISDALTAGSIPKGTFADDQVRNLIAFYNWQRKALEAIAGREEDPEQIAAVVLERIKLSCHNTNLYRQQPSNFDLEAPGEVSSSLLTGVFLLACFAIVDVANLFHRARHVVRGDAYQKSGMALSIVFNSLRKLFREYKANHVVLCLEGRSWRFDVYPRYKSKRRADKANLKPAEIEDEQAFFETMNDFANFMTEKTRVTVLQSPGVEGDDFVARWIQLHPQDEHILLSGDSDFIQLLAPNVRIYDGVEQRLITSDGVFNDKGQAMVFGVNPSDGKLKVGLPLSQAQEAHDKAQREEERKHKAAEKEREAALKKTGGEYKPIPFYKTEFSFAIEPEWWRKALFIKIIRGDTSDSIFSSYPGVRYESKKISIKEAWEDRDGQGYHWNNFMLQTWDKLTGTDEAGNNIVKKVRVLDEYRFNEMLIDLTKQPQNVKDLMDHVILDAVQKEPIGNVGIHFLRFCDRHELPRLAKDAGDHAAYLNAAYSS